MGDPAEFTRGGEPLRRLLAEHTFDLRGLELDDFRQWLERHLEHWQRDEVFAQRTRIRQLRQACPDLRRLERRHRQLIAEDAASPHFHHLQRVERQLHNAGKAIQGLRGALEHASAERRAELERKLRDFQDRRERLQHEQEKLVESSTERRRLLQIDRELQQLRASIGLDREEQRLRKQLTERGQHRGRRGHRFEHSAAAAVQREIVPELVLPATGDVHVLREVTLGAADIEFDVLIVSGPASSDQVVDVLAVVETKRNINDLAHGFRRRQANLAWLTGDAASYDPQAHRTRRFPTGHFDREAVHRQPQNSFRFTRDSFRRFARQGDWYLDRLYFVTRPGPLWGLPGRALARLAYRTATDLHWDEDDEHYLRGLMHWAQSLAAPLEAPDVLRLYLASVSHARQILLLTPPSLSSST